MKLLFTTPLIGVPPVGGPELRVANSIKALAQISELHIFPRCFVSASTMRFLHETCKGVIHVAASTENPLDKSMITRLEKSMITRPVRKVMTKLLPGTVASIRDKVASIRDTREAHEQTSTIIRYAEAQQIDAVWFSYGCISYSLMRSIRRAAPNMRLICDTDSVWSQFISRELPFEKFGARRKEIIRKARTKISEEKQWVNFCDVTTAICDADAEYYRNLAQDPSAIRIFRNAIDISAYDVAVVPPPNHKRPNLVMMGSYFNVEYSPMVRSARWVVSDVLPRVRAAIPQIHLYIVGTGSEILKDLESDNISIIGRVESTLPYLKHANVALAPLQFEAAGPKYKVLEAAVCEVPIVATPVGAEGLPAGYHKYMRVCSGASEFASGILEMVEKDSKAAERLREFRMLIARDFGLEQLSAEGAEILRYIYAK
jgi:polysaccharide biosynthesis protein PslH